MSEHDRESRDLANRLGLLRPCSDCEGMPVFRRDLDTGSAVAMVCPACGSQGEALPILDEIIEALKAHGAVAVTFAHGANEHPWREAAQCSATFRDGPPLAVHYPAREHSLGALRLLRVVRPT